MKFSVTDTDQGFEKIIENLHELSFNDIDVGFFDGHMSADGTMTMAELAGLQMNGTTDGLGIPKRDFMSECAIVNEDLVAKELTSVAKKAIDGSNNVKGLLKEVGEEYSQLMKDSIDDFSTPKNTKYTIQHKTFVKEDNPLVDTGEMRDGIEFRVRGKF